MSGDKRGTNDNLSPVAIMEMAGAFQQSRVLLTAFELGLFTVLANESRTSREVADALGAAPRATDRLMNALSVLRLLEKHGDQFANAPLAAKFLVKGQPAYMANLGHTTSMWESWSTLTEAVRRGTSVMGRLEDRNDRWNDVFIAAMHHFAGERATAVVAQIDLAGVSRVIDIGGGSGAYSMAFVRAREGIRATVFDLPYVAGLARKYIDEEGLSDKIDVVVGDYNKDDFGAGFDVAFLSAIIHANSVEENRSLIARAAEALNPGGQLVVSEFVVDEDRLGPPFAVLFALNMLVGTAAGDTYTELEISGWMTEAGLSDIVRKETDFNASHIIGRKAS